MSERSQSKSVESKRTGEPGLAKPGKGRSSGRMLTIFKSLVLLVIFGITAYGMLRNGLYKDELWLPVAAGLLLLVAITLFVRRYYEDVPGIGWALVVMLGILVGVKGLSMTWTISEAETIKEVLRSSMYLGVFAMSLAALQSGRQVGPLIDIAVLIVAAVAGYGLLQKISPIEYPVTSLDGVRIDSTLDYVNTFALVLGMGVALALARVTRLRNFAFRGLYAALMLAFLTALYLTLSRGGIGSLVIGLVVLFVLSNERLQMMGNLILVSIPGAWLFWRMNSLDGLWRANVPDEQKISDGTTFRNYLLIALAVALVLQVVYSFLVKRYELMPLGRKTLGGLAIGGAAIAALVTVFVVINNYGGVSQSYNALLNNPDSTKVASQRLSSADIGFRSDYWKVAWEEWKDEPLTGSGAGTFQFVWLENRPVATGVKQVHNLYLEQGTETGIFAFIALLGFSVTLLGYTALATWRSGETGDRRVLLSGLAAAIAVYLVSSIIEWHWYIPPSTLFFFILAAIAVKLSAVKEWNISEPG